MRHRFALGSLLLLLPSFALAQNIDFQKQVRPILESACISCHGAEHDKGELRLHTIEDVRKGAGTGPVLKPGDPASSSLYTTTVLPADDELVMPPKKSGLLLKEQTEILKQWIAQGAKWPEGVVLKQIPRVDFVKDVQPILEVHCVACHREGEDKGDLRLDDKFAAFQGGTSGAAIVPGDATQSPVYTTTILPADDDALMPPKKKGGPLPREVTDVLKNWIDSGAPWPDGVKLTARKAEAPTGAAAEPALVKQIHDRIIAGVQPATEKEMQPYSTIIAGSEVAYEMVPIPAGKFKMGSPENEAGRKADEAPVHEVEIAPFWMGKHEVTWNEFELFMYPEEEKRNRASREPPAEVNAVTDATTRPTQPYVEMSFGMGKDGFPAISMTQHAAIKYCQWLSAKTGHFYRLPTEAEWEYACRAGTTTAYYWGDDASKIGDHCWWGKNSDFKYQKVGKKLPNAWGLHDMLGNVIEWTLDAYDPAFYARSSASNPWNKATKPYPHVARGGSWDDDDPAKLRAAARRFSDPSWKIQDPQLPKSIWYHTDAQFLGFRVVRPLKTPTEQEMFAYWNSGVEKDVPPAPPQ